MIHFIEDLNKFLFDSWSSLTSLLPQVTGMSGSKGIERIDDYDRCEIVLDCLLLIANVRRYWISVDVTKNINTEEEITNYSCIDLDVWMGLFSTILTTDIPLFCFLSLFPFHPQPTRRLAPSSRTSKPPSSISAPRFHVSTF